MLKPSCCTAAILAILIPLVSTLPVTAQNRGPGGPPLPAEVYTMPTAMAGNGFPSVSGASPEIERRMQNQMNQNREMELKRDTDQLMEMASELKHQVDQTGPAILSMDVIKKAEKIEKLAKSVREKMKGN